MVSTVSTQLRCLAWSLGWLACACAGQSEPANTSDFAINGTVSDDASGGAVHGARVTFVADTLEQTSALTDDHGHYAMVVQVSAGVRFGTLRASATGYQDSAQATVYFDGTARTVDLALRATGK
jgi:hypothetical protein